jgi:hypothetical protein
MRLGWFASPLVHGALLASLLLAWPQEPRELAPESAIVPIDVVNFSDFSNVKAIAPDAPPAPDAQPQPHGAPQEAAKPPDEDVEVVPDKAAKPPPKPEDKPRVKPNLDQLALLIDRAKKERGQSAAQTAPNAERGPDPRKGVGAGDNLSANERDFIRSKLEACWRSNADSANPAQSRVTVRYRLNRNGSLNGEPTLVAPAVIAPADVALQAAARNALNAVRECAPFTGLRPERYAYWRVVVTDFGANGVE